MISSASLPTATPLPIDARYALMLETAISTFFCSMALNLSLSSETSIKSLFPNPFRLQKLNGCGFCRLRNHGKRVQGDVSFPAFNRADVSAMNLANVGKSILTQPHLLTSGADISSRDCIDVFFRNRYGDDDTFYAA